MSDTRRGSNQKAPRGQSKGSGCPAAFADAYGGGGESISPLPLGADGRCELKLGEANADILDLGDILVDVDTGPGGMRLALWIVGG